MAIDNGLLGVATGQGSTNAIVDNSAHLTSVDHKIHSQYNSKLGSTPTFSNSSGSYSFSNAGHGNNILLNTMENNAESNSDLRAMLNENLETLGTGKETRDLKRQVENFSRNAERNVRDFGRVAENAIKKNVDAITVLNKEHAKLKADMLTEHSKSLAEFAKGESEFLTSSNRQNVQVRVNGQQLTYNTPDALKAGRDLLQQNHERASAHLDSIHRTQTDLHNDSIAEVKSTVAKVEEHTGLKIPLKRTEAIAHDAKALEHTAGTAAKEERAALKAGMGASVGIVAAGTTIGAVIGSQFNNKETGGQSGTWWGALVGGVTSFAAKNHIARFLNIASQTASHVR